ncbi:MAG: ribonuclease P protein component 1 [Nitrososphaerota archaeon]
MFKQIPITPKNILNHEIIGLEVKIVSSKNPLLNNLKGIIIGETKNTLKILSNNKKKIIPKNVCIFHFKLKNGEIIEVNGEKIVGRPEERLKRRFREW